MEIYMVIRKNKDENNVLPAWVADAYDDACRIYDRESRTHRVMLLQGEDAPVGVKGFFRIVATNFDHSIEGKIWGEE